MLGIRKALRGKRSKKADIPFHMFDLALEAKAARQLEGIYHKGQRKIWDGKALLAELVDKHGGVQIEPHQLEPLKRLFAIIFWGELAAWKVSAELALHIEPLEAKMAATAQAHDEARHFYVLHDYLELVGYTPEELPHHAKFILDNILQADTLVKKLIGMQLMVEPIALTLFQLVRANNLEPVLCDLLVYFERDEARHVALGVNYLPKMFEGMSRLEVLDLWRWQIKMLNAEIDGAKQLAEDFETLGFSPREVLRLGTGKQLKTIEMLAAEMSFDMPAVEIFTRMAEARMELEFPLDRAGRLTRMRRAANVLAFGHAERTISPLEHLYAK